MTKIVSKLFRTSIWSGCAHAVLLESDSEQTPLLSEQTPSSRTACLLNMSICSYASFYWETKDDSGFSSVTSSHIIIWISISDERNLLSLPFNHKALKASWLLKQVNITGVAALREARSGSLRRPVVASTAANSETHCICACPYDPPKLLPLILE